jgi:hypothetical protein
VSPRSDLAVVAKKTPIASVGDRTAIAAHPASVLGTYQLSHLI